MALSAPVLFSEGGLTALVVPVRWLSILIPPTPMVALDAAALYPHAVGLLDGPMFAPCAGGPQGYADYQCGRTETALYDGWTGAAQRGWMPGAGATILRRVDRAEVVSGLPTLVGIAGIDLVLQARPELVREGVVVASTTIDTSAVRRAAVALLDATTAALVVSRPMGMHVFGTALRTVLGAREAVYTDGGGSTELLVAGRPAGGTTGRSRRLPTFIAAIDPDARSLGP